MARIVVENLSKTFQIAERRPGMLGAAVGLVRRRRRTVRALVDVSFTVEPGELVAAIGPNGAGKSTMIKILSGVLVPTGGRCEVDGLIPWKQRIEHVARIGVVFGQRTQLWWDLPVLESFDLLRSIYRVDRETHNATRDELIDRLNLGAILATPVRQLSLGQRMRCEFTAALLHQPSLLFLDEPTIGLDAVSRLAIRDFIRELNRRSGITVILTTHNLDDVEAVCNRVIVLCNGRLLSDSTMNDLRNQVSRERRLIIDLEEPCATVEDEQATTVNRDGGRVILTFDPKVVAPAKLIARITKKHPVRDLFVEHPPIEQIISKLYDQNTVPDPTVRR